MKVFIHFFRHSKLEKVKIRTNPKLIVKDHSFMTLTKNIKKFELPSPHPQPRFWFDSKKHVHNNYGSHVYNKTDVTLRVFLYIWNFFCHQNYFKVFSSCCSRSIWQVLTPHGTLFFCAISKTNLYNFQNKQLGLFFLKS